MQQKRAWLWSRDFFLNFAVSRDAATAELLVIQCWRLMEGHYGQTDGQTEEHMTKAYTALA